MPNCIHAEQPTLSYSVLAMQRQEWLGIDGDTQKHLVLCGLDLVECIAKAATLRKR